MATEHGHGIGFVQAAEVEKITVLPEAMMHVSVVGHQVGGGQHHRCILQAGEQTLASLGMGGLIRMGIHGGQVWMETVK